MQVRGYGLAVVIYRKEASDITTSEELKKEMKRRKRIDLLDGADVEPWDPRPVRCVPETGALQV